ncbi:MAG: AAA family ATPase [Acidobacteria bacterium]|nr:AAA family ATPase [Acidobacteriota bacterium]
MSTPLNPRKFLLNHGQAALIDLLRSVNYRLQPGLVRDLCHVLRTSLPWLIAGPRGGGKTALAEALAEACALPIFYLQGMDGITLEDIIGRWDRQAQDMHVRYEVEFGKRPLAEVREEIHSREFFLFADPLAAYAYAEANGLPPIFILDEADKLDVRAQDMLLQLLGRGFAYVPGLGKVGVSDQSLWPVVIILSNDMRHELSAPFRSRCLFSMLPMPNIIEQAEILHLRCSDAPLTLVREMAKVLDALQSIASISDKPGPREAIQLIRALHGAGIATLNREVLDEHVAFLAKNQKDILNIEKATDRLAVAARSPHQLIDAWGTI